MNDHPHSDPHATPWLDLLPGAGSGAGKRIVLIAGDEEYRSEEALPMLAGILTRHGFACRVVFPIDPASGCVDPDHVGNLPGLEALADADLMIISTRFRDLPEAQMACIDTYLRSGRPLIGIRTATHAFRCASSGAFAKYSFDSNVPGWEGGFGRRVLGECWVAHHGQHGVEGTRGVVEPTHATHPILRGVAEVFGPSDVYTVRDLPADAQVLLRGQVTQDLTPSSLPVTDARNQPMMPLVWLRRHRGEDGHDNQVLCTTIGAAVDFASADLRRLLVNACYWLTGLGKHIRSDGAVDPVDPYRPSPFGLSQHVHGRRPIDFAPNAGTSKSEKPRTTDKHRT